MQRWHAVSSQVAEELRIGKIEPLFRDLNGGERVSA